MIDHDILVRCLASFDPSIGHYPGRLHGNADSMSRRPLLMSAQCETCHDETLAHKTHSDSYQVTPLELWSHLLT